MSDQRRYGARPLTITIGPDDGVDPADLVPQPWQDQIGAVALAGTALTMTWDVEGDDVIGWISTGEDPVGLPQVWVYRSVPRWVSAWAGGTNQSPICGDADPLLLPVADGPPNSGRRPDAGEAHRVGEWIALVLAAVVGHTPASETFRDFVAAGYTAIPADPDHRQRRVDSMAGPS